MQSVSFKNGVLGAAFMAMFAFAAPHQTLAVGGGAVDDEYRYPNVCAVLGLRDGDLPPRIASGVLIHPRVVLTAGHVTDWFATIWDIDVDDVRISFAVDARDESAWLTADGYCTHPLYNGFEGAEGLADPHDLGVIILSEPVPGTNQDPDYGIDPAVLPDEGFLDLLKDVGLLQFGVESGTPMTVVGYGRGLSFPPPAEIAGDYFRIRRYGANPAMGISPAFLHVWQDPDGISTQRSDSGGPTFLEIGDQRILVATTSWSGALLGIDHRYRVDTTDSLDFIDAVLSSVECSN